MFGKKLEWIKNEARHWKSTPNANYVFCIANFKPLSAFFYDIAFYGVGSVNIAKMSRNKTTIVQQETHRSIETTETTETTDRVAKQRKMKQPRQDGCMY